MTSLLVLSLSMIGLLAVGHCSESPARFLAKPTSNQYRPSVAPYWTANFSFDIPNPESLGWYVDKGLFVYDGVLQKARMDRYGGYSEKFGPDATYETHNYAWRQKEPNGQFWEVQNGQCFSNRQEFYLLNFFAWFPYASMNGTDTFTYDGDKTGTCQKWTWSYQGLGDCLACTYFDGQSHIPIYLFMSELEPFKHNGKMHFSNFKYQTQDVFYRYGSFTLPESCDPAQRKTCGTGEIKTMKVYWSHPTNNYDISGQDVADLKGDAAFLCVDKEMWTIGDYSLLTEYEIKYLDTFSQYTNFPYGCPPDSTDHCISFGGDGKHVGRASVLNVGRHGGQCDDDADWWNKVGIWYSMPPDGQCTPGKTLGADCTWQVEKQGKTIDFDCLFNKHRMVDMCKTTKAPFDDVTELLKKALNSTDVSQGGCPAVPTI